MLNLLFAILIITNIKGQNYKKLYQIYLWKELINPQIKKEHENMASVQKWRLKVVKNFWPEEEQEEENH